MANATDVGSCIGACANSTEDKNVTGESTSHHYSVITLYISPLHRIVFTVVIVFIACVVLEAIHTLKKKCWNTLYEIEYFFVRNLLVSDIIAVVVHNGFVCIVALWSIASPHFKGVSCTIASIFYIPYCANSLFVILACIDRLLFFVQRQPYTQVMKHRRIRYAIVFGVWAFSALGIIPIFLDPELQTNAVTGVCKYRPFSNRFGIVFLLLPSLLSAVIAVIQNAIIFRIAYKAVVAEEQRRKESGSSGKQPKCPIKERNARNSRKSAITSLMLGGSHLVFGGIFSVIEFMIFPLFDGLTYDILKYILALYFGFLNISAHSILYGYRMSKIRENMKICGKSSRVAHVHTNSVRS